MIATKGHILNGLCPGIGFGPDSPDAKRRVEFLKVADGSWERIAGLVELAKRWEKRRGIERDMMSCCLAGDSKEREAEVKPGETGEIVKVLAALWG